MKTVTILNPIDFFNKVIELNKHFGGIELWWRGHADLNWKLHPSIYHKNIAINEVNISNRFRNHARAIYKEAPANDDLISWVSLMQHYKLPTRLLDWTTSPLVALYFAINHSCTINDAVVWCLNPVLLNENQLNTKGIVGRNNQEVRKSIRSIFSKESPKSSYILAFQSQHFDIRQLVQESEFTLHGVETPLEELNESHKFLGRIVIPKNQIEGFKQLLFVLNIRRVNLFPDLENLSEYLQGLEFDNNV